MPRLAIYLLFIVVALVASQSADAAIRIPVERDTARMIAIIGNGAMLIGAVVCIYMKNYRGGLILLALVLLPAVITALVWLSGTPVLWW